MYAANPALLPGWIPVAGIIGFIWSLFILIQRLKVCSGLSYLRSILIVMVLIPLLVILLILLLGLTESFTVVGSDKSSVLDVMMATCPFI